MAKTMKFETALTRLEEIVRAMESGDLDLDRSLSLFEEGVRLVKFCSGKLDEAKRSVEVLVQKDGGLVPRPFDPAEAGREDDR